MVSVKMKTCHMGRILQQQQQQSLATSLKAYRENATVNNGWV